MKKFSMPSKTKVARPVNAPPQLNSANAAHITHSHPRNIKPIKPEKV